MVKIAGGLILACVFFANNFAAFAMDSIETRPVHFSKAASSATFKGTIKGYEIIDYKLAARAGQTMRVLLKTSNLSNYFNILPPRSKDEAIFIGSINGNEWTGTLMVDGEYTARVYLMRSAARRNEVANYTLTVSITGSDSPVPASDSAPSGDAKVRDTPYHATGHAPCSTGDAPRGSVQCEFGVIRGKSGDAEVHVTPPGGFKRVLIFAGSNVGSDTDASVKAQKNGDMWLIEVNDYEHYQIPEAVIVGG